MIAICRLGLFVVLLMTTQAVAKSSGDTIEPGDIRGEHNFYSVVFYFAPAPTTNTFLLAEKLTQRLLPGVSFTANLKTRPKPPFVGVQEEKTPLKKFPVPEASYFKYSGRGLSEKDIAAFQKTDRATRLVMVVPKEDVWRLGRKFTELIQQFADGSGAYVWDSATRECFSRDSWRERRLTGWPERGIPDVTRHVTVHLYRPDDKSPYLRAITLGMEKFALPDVVIERMIGSDRRPAGNLINLVCQSLAERPVIQHGEKEKFQLDALQASAFRSNMVSSLETGATREIVVALLKGNPQDGDPDNRLIELDFRHGKGKTEDERREDLLATLWGANDSITGAKHTEEVLQASQRARGRLASLRASFEKGLPPGSRLLVKAPFKRDDEGNEWMWVEVMQWRMGATIEGLLQNDPFYIRKLKAGAKVQVRVADVFDYILYHEDGSTEGNETGKLMDKQGGETKRK